MEKVINCIRSDLKNVERLDIVLQIDENLMFATPTNNGKWRVTLKSGDSVEGVYSATNSQLEQIAREMLLTCGDCQFSMIQKRDDSGYYVGQYYRALKPVIQPQPKRRTLRQIFALKNLWA